MRIAVFGGSFNPPHNGHRNLVEEIHRHGLAEKVILIPAFRPPHKPNTPLADYEHRVAMTKLAFAGLPWVEVNELESRRPEKLSYTFDTMVQLESEYPNDELLLLIGADSLANLHSWYQAEELAERWQVISYPRPGDNPTLADLQYNWPPHLAERLAAGLNKSLPEAAVSSTAIRHALHFGVANGLALPAEVAEYIRKNQLYR